MRCPRTMCVDNKAICDGVIDCLDGRDEEYCCKSIITVLLLRRPLSPFGVDASSFHSTCSSIMCFFSLCAFQPHISPFQCWSSALLTLLVILIIYLNILIYALSSNTANPLSASRSHFHHLICLLLPFSAIPPCNASMFRCRDGACIDLHQRCDTVDDCGDMSDELDCRTHCISIPINFVIFTHAMCNGISIFSIILKWVSSTNNRHQQCIT